MTAACEALEVAYRTEARRVLATLIRLLGGFEIAEEALHEAFAAAAERWPREGVPANRYAWLVSAGRFKTIDRWRRQARLAAALPDLAALTASGPELTDPEPVPDDELRLLFTCCHPGIPPDARVALTLREVGGLTTEEIARAYLTPVSTIAQRIVRAKAMFRDYAIPYELPVRADLPGRIESVLQVIYLIFNEGYAASQGASLLRTDLCADAVRLGRLAADLLADPEASGLLALMLLHQARCATRADAAGDLVLLENQDRLLWDRKLIAEAKGLIQQAVGRRVGPYILQAAIAAVHVDGPSFVETDWTRIVSLYDSLRRICPSSVVALNHAVAVGMRDGPDAGLTCIEAVMADGALDDYHLAHAARADMQRRLGLVQAARTSYQRALKIARQPAERRFLERRLAEMLEFRGEP